MVGWGVASSIQCRVLSYLLSLDFPMSLTLPLPPSLPNPIYFNSSINSRIYQGNKSFHMAEASPTQTANLYTASANNRITKYNFDEQTHQIVVEDDIMSQPRDIVFLNHQLFAVSNDWADAVLVYDVSGGYKGVLINVSEPNGLLLFPDGSRLAVASPSNEVVFVYNMTGAIVTDESNDTASIIPRTDEHIVYTTLPMTDNSNLKYLTFGSDINEVIITTKSTSVMRRCIHEDCNPDRNSIMLYSVEDRDHRGILTIPSMPRNTYLLAGRATRKVYLCDLDAPVNQLLEESCSIFTDDIYDPWSIAVDEIKQIIYISDKTALVITMFDYDGNYLGNLGSSGSLTAIVGLALRPGLYSPLSPIIDNSPDIPKTAGESITFPLILKDSYGNNITAAAAVSPERFSIEAKGLITVKGVTFPGSFFGTVTRADDALPHLLSAEISSNFAGEYSVNIMESADAVPSHLLGSPLGILVGPGVTDALSCISWYPQTVNAGEEFRVVVQTFDEFDNPTDYEEEDKFIGWEEGSGVADNSKILYRVMNVDTGKYEFTFEDNRTVADSYRFHVLHEKTAVEVANSPFSIQVVPSKPDLLSSFHNLELGSLDTSDEVDLLLQVFPLDEYKNYISSATGYTVTLIRGFRDEQTFDLEAPSFSTTFLIEKSFEGKIDVSFMQNGDHVKNSPMTIRCSSEALVPVAVSTRNGNGRRNEFFGERHCRS